MSSTRFVVQSHDIRTGEQMVEVWVGGEFVGALYPGTRSDELRFVSKHLVSSNLDSAYPPALQILLSLGGTRQ
jgi:hypothetical protein